MPTRAHISEREFARSLAKSVLEKDDGELAELARRHPRLLAEWFAELAREQTSTAAEVAFFASARARLVGQTQARA